MTKAIQTDPAPARTEGADDRAGGHGAAVRVDGVGIRFGSFHAGGANFVLCDGSVRFLRETMPFTTLYNMSTIAAGEVFDASDL